MNTAYITSHSQNFNLGNARILNFGKPNDVIAIIETIFNWSGSFIELNEILLSFIDARITNPEGRAIIESLICDDSIFDFHPSLLQTILIMTTELNDFENERAKIKDRIIEVLPNYQ